MSGCWECGERVSGGVCEREHPCFDLERAVRAGNVDLPDRQPCGLTHGGVYEAFLLAHIERLQARALRRKGREQRQVMGVIADIEEWLAEQRRVPV